MSLFSKKPKATKHQAKLGVDPTGRAIVLVASGRGIDVFDRASICSVRITDDAVALCDKDGVELHLLPAVKNPAELCGELFRALSGSEARAAALPLPIPPFIYRAAKILVAGLIFFFALRVLVSLLPGGDSVAAGSSAPSAQLSSTEPYQFNPKLSLADMPEPPKLSCSGDVGHSVDGAPQGINLK